MPLSWNEIRARALDAAYAYRGALDDTGRTAFLFTLYQQLIAAL